MKFYIFVIKIKNVKFTFLANNYGLFRVEEDNTKCVWMENGRTLEYYLIRNGVCKTFKIKHKQFYSVFPYSFFLVYNCFTDFS